jgi:hypothetical protein
VDRRRAGRVDYDDDDDDETIRRRRRGDAAVLQVCTSVSTDTDDDTSEWYPPIDYFPSRVRHIADTCLLSSYVDQS